MPNATNGNHPKKGDTIKVYPFKTLEDIAAIRNILRDKPRDLLLFTIGINTPFFPKDLVGLKVSDVQGIRTGKLFSLEDSSSKAHEVFASKKLCDAIKDYLKLIPTAKGNDYLFCSRKGNSHIQSSYLSSLVKKWARDAGIKGHFGGESLRKTFGFGRLMLVPEDQRDIFVITALLHQPSPLETLKFLDIFYSASPTDTLASLRLLKLINNDSQKTFTAFL